MNQLKFIFAFLLLSSCAWAKDVYDVRKLSEREMLKTYTSLMVDACRHSEQFWKAASFDSTAGYWGDGASDGNQGIRAIGEMIFVHGTLLKYSSASSATERAASLNKISAALRFVCATHVTGTQKCPDGKSWGGSWQSAMWAGTLGFGAWLVWDRLEPQLQRDIERVIASEADRFLAGRPPGGTSNDTKAEENGWNLICISLAANMFPKHPHAAAWNAKAIAYMINTLSAPQDRHDKTLVDGRPVSEWFSGENLHADFTLENHGFFHPAYVACSSYFLTQSAMHFTYADRPIPKAATHHLQDVWKMFQRLILPSGEPAYPQGMDWELHGITVINLFSALATYQKDALAARWEGQCLQYMRGWQMMEEGNLAVPGSRLGFTRHAICAEQAAYGFLAHKLFGPPVKQMSARKAALAVSGVRRLDSVGIVTHRTENKFVSVSWRSKIGGMLIPIGEGHDGQPFFTVPIANGLIGSFDVVPAENTKIMVEEYECRDTAKGFETTGTLLLNNSRLKQNIKITSIGEKAVVYQDRVVALADVSITAEQGIPVGIENDKVTGGTRTVFHQEEESIFDFTKPQSPVTISGSWANVDGRLGIVTLAGSGMKYAQAKGYHPGMAVCADVRYGSFSEQARNFKAGEEVARRVVVFYLEVDPKRTAALTKACSIAANSGGRVLHLNLPEGGKAQVPLL